MSCRKDCPAIKGSASASGVSVIIDRRVSRFVWLAGFVLKTLIRISSAGIKYGQPGECREFHRDQSLIAFGCVSQGRQVRTIVTLGGCFGQRYDQHRASGSLQNTIRDAAQEKVRKRASTMRPENNEVDPRIFCLGQDQLGRAPLEFDDC
jgi:hypothetical protein